MAKSVLSAGKSVAFIKNCCEVEFCNILNDFNFTNNCGSLRWINNLRNYITTSELHGTNSLTQIMFNNYKLFDHLKLLKN